VTLPELTPQRWLTAWSLDLPVLVLVLALTAGYLLLVRRSREPWPRRSTALFVLAGLGTLVLTTMSFLGTYDRVLLWPLAVQDVLLLTVVPVGLTLGRPLALLQAAFPRRPRRSSRVTRLLGFPLVGSVLAVVVLLAVYTTGWDQARLDSPALLEATRLLLVVVGCSFLWPLLGVDAGTGSTSYPVRAVVAFVDGLLDAVPGLVVLGTGHAIAAAHYAAVGRTYGRDQEVGGAAMVALSELVGLPAMLVLLVQWVRSDARQARDVDAELDVVAAAARAVRGPERNDEPAQGRPWWEDDAGPLAGRNGWKRAPRS
jgi:cytochrome c oxidase assembly factor CtaG